MENATDTTRSRRDPSDRNALERLEAAHERLDAAAAAIEDAGGESTVESGAQAYRNAAKLLEDYAEKASGSGRETFKHYIQLEGQFSTLVEQLPEDLPQRGAFETAFDHIDKRRLNERDFERAEDALDPASEVAALIDEREAAQAELTAARRAASSRLEALEREIERHERLVDLEDADLEAPVDRLSEPITGYNEAVRDAFETFFYDVSARELFALLERSRHHPFVPFERPPEELRTYVTETDAGEHTIPQLLEYADFSRSKLAHHVDDPDQLKRRIATRRTYLERLDAEPLCLPWPPEDAVTLRYRVRDVRPLAERVGGQDLVDRLRAVREVSRDPDYDRLQTAAQAVEQLSDDERRRLAAGTVEDDLESLRRERTRLETLLEQ